MYNHRRGKMWAESSYEKLCKIAEESHNWKEVCRKLGYKDSSRQIRGRVQTKFDDMQIDYSHFAGGNGQTVIAKMTIHGIWHSYVLCVIPQKSIQK